MKPSSYRPSGKNNFHEWVSAIGTLLVLTGVYASMDNFSSYDTTEKTSPPPKSSASQSVAPPYWNTTLGYGFRSLAGDVYDASGSALKDVVLIRKNDSPGSKAGDVTVSYYKNKTIDEIDKNHEDTPRTVSRLSHGIAVIEGDIDSPRVKTIFSTLHSE